MVKNSVSKQKIDSIKFSSLQKKIIKDGYLDIRIISGSMHPLIRVDEIVRVHPVAELSLLERFDILVYWNGSELICHYLLGVTREIRKDRLYLQTKGLVGESKDFLLEPQNVLGVVQRRVPFLLRLREFYKLFRMKNRL